eukprot:c12700_g2_i3.p1 GENE.c12700_g2_i3~~c12700_g2_i3.p1  ORF type:complete len:175 (+),score=34.01 c12700_g2_i3:490-1014(+)
MFVFLLVLLVQKVLACVLDQVVTRNDRIPLASNKVTIFHALRPPNIGVKNYLERVHKFVNCSNECYVLALIYMDRIIQRNPDFFISSLNVHRLIICSVMLAAKFFDDRYYNNAFYARVGGIPTPELNNLEVEYLFMINFSLVVETEEYERYRKELEIHLAQLSSTNAKSTVVEI